MPDEYRNTRFPTAGKEPTIPTDRAIHVSGSDADLPNKTQVEAEPQSKLQTGKLKRRNPGDGQRFPVKTQPETKKLARPFCQIGTPWQRYVHFLESEVDAGPASIIYEKNSRPPFYAVKRRTKKPDWSEGDLVKVMHLNIVALVDAFHTDNEFFLVYETNAVSLEHVQSCDYGPLKEPEIATVCKGVLQGLTYIHQTLSVGPPELLLSSVMIHARGFVKIGNIGDSLLNRSLPSDSAQVLGHLLYSLLKPGLHLTSGPSFRLPEATKWTNAVSRFLQRCETDTIQELGKDSFLELSPGPACLADYVEVVRRCPIGVR